mmetsp:Transcript_117780/g.305688  ORF Transcript_117780/g.305688 Transcript_117780/m.305688 type:complete len:660 (+) Transcript_117780:67-2046(+)
MPKPPRRLYEEDGGGAAHKVAEAHRRPGRIRRRQGEPRIVPPGDGGSVGISASVEEEEERTAEVRTLAAMVAVTAAPSADMQKSSAPVDAALAGGCRGRCAGSMSVFAGAAPLQGTGLTSAVGPMVAGSAIPLPVGPRLVLAGEPRPVPAQLPEQVHSGESLLMEMLAAMDQHMQHLRETQQGLVATVELACRRALDRNFGRLVLVGSAALRVETPGSDVDVVCFTRREGADDKHMAGLPVDILRRIHWALKDLINQYSYYAASFSMELIEDARVPILRVLWGPTEHPIAVDVSVDQTQPVDHVRWFQRVGAAPRPTAPPPVVAPLVTLTLRCVKWWLRQRQIPRTKEGGLPTLAWLLMAVHVCSLPETHEQAMASGRRPMAALLAFLGAFFRHYSSLHRLDGVLRFAPDGSASDFRRRARPRDEPWAELAVLDPTREGAESLNLAPRLPPATQLLLAYELQRAGSRLERIPKTCEAAPGTSRQILEEVFESLPDGTNALPSFLAAGIGVLVLRMEAEDGTQSVDVEVGIAEHIVTRPGWAAPFLLRSDERSEFHVKLCNVEDYGVHCELRKACPIVLGPCDFICRVGLEKDGRGWNLDKEGAERLQVMRRLVRDVFLDTEDLENVPPKAQSLSSTWENGGGSDLTTLPSPMRSRCTQI